MANRLYQALVRNWMRQLTRRGRTTHLRAVFLGDIVSTEVIIKGMYEEFQLDVLKDLVFSQLDPKSICLDIGANIGNHACFFDQHFERVIAFEPNPVVHHVLCANTIGYGIEAERLGLSDERGELWFKENQQNLGGSGIVDDADQADFKIPVIPLDDYVTEKGLQTISFMKIDVEGHELNMLQGARDTIRNHRPILAAEGYFKKDPAMGQDIERFLREVGYRFLYRMVPAHPLARSLTEKGYRVDRGLLTIILPENIKRKQTLELVNTLAGQDHSLFIASMEPLEKVEPL